MRTDLRCKSCQCKLSVDARLQGKSIKCPKCTSLIKVMLMPVVLPQLGKKQTGPHATPMMAIPLDEEPVLAEVLPDDPGFDVLPDEEPVATAVPVPLPPRRTMPAVPVVDDEEEEETPKPKKKKKKKKMQADSVTSIPVWMWVLGGLGALITTGGVIFGIILAMRVGTADGQPIDWANHFIFFAIRVPLSLVILIISMFLSSALGGGINFGDAKTAIIGSVFLVVIVNMVYMIPVAGPWLTLLVWLVGFMTIFGLDPWEARFLLFINWVLNYALGMAVFHFFINMHMKQIEMEEDEDFRPSRSRPRERNRDKTKGKINNQKNIDPDDDPDDDGMGYYRPGDWHDRMQDWVERQQKVVA